MCGRYALYSSPEVLKNLFNLENILNLPVRYNCAPTQNLPVIVKNRMGLARWGFRPEWAKDDSPAMTVKMINARSETVQEKPAFRESWQRGRRCLVPMDGFYEWHTPEGGEKQAYFIYNPDGGPLFAAGLWSKIGEQVTFTILTKQAAGNIANLHHRMPVLVSVKEQENWFFSNGPEIKALIEKSNAEQLIYHAVNNRVGRVSEDDAGLIKEAA